MSYHRITPSAPWPGNAVTKCLVPYQFHTNTFLRAPPPNIIGEGMGARVTCPPKLGNMKANLDSPLIFKMLRIGFPRVIYKGPNANVCVKQCNTHGVWFYILFVSVERFVLVNNVTAL